MFQETFFDSKQLQNEAKEIDVTESQNQDHREFLVRSYRFTLGDHPDL